MIVYTCVKEFIIVTVVDFGDAAAAVGMVLFVFPFGLLCRIAIAYNRYYICLSFAT